MSRWLAMAALTAALHAAQTPLPQATGSAYATMVEQYRRDPSAALVSRIIEMPVDDLAASVRLARTSEPRWTTDQLNAAMLLHVEAALTLVRQKDDRCWLHIQTGQDLGDIAALDPDNARFVQQWYYVVIESFHDEARLQPINRYFHTRPWFAPVAELENGLYLERRGISGTTQLSPAGGTLGALAFQQAIVHYERATESGVLLGALHAGRLHMLRGSGKAARTMFEKAVLATTPSTKYLSNLFLGSLDELDGDAASAERHYRDAVTLFPFAQSGRLALASLLARHGRAAEASAMAARRPPPDSSWLGFDPWWLYIPPAPFDVTAALTAMYAEVQR